MKLASAQIQNFKSIEDSNEFKIGSTPALVGKNESGKSALLEALYKFKPVVATEDKFVSAIEFYPRRRWSNYKDRNDSQPDNVLTTKWTIEPDDLAALEVVFGKGAVAATEVTIWKGYDNTRRNVDLKVDETQVAAHRVAAADLYQEEASRLVDLPNVQAVRKVLSDNTARSDRENAFLTQLTADFAEVSAS